LRQSDVGLALSGIITGNSRKISLLLEPLRCSTVFARSSIVNSSGFPMLSFEFYMIEAK
jgi:hypothetical protein